MRSARIAAALIVLLGLLSAFPAPAEPIVALAVHDGQPVGILVTCHDAFSQLSVHENNPAPDPGDDPLVTWRVTGYPATDVVEVPLLGPPPPGWEVGDHREIPAAEAGIRVTSVPLTELRPGVRYSLGGSSYHKAMTVSFTTADFDRIGGARILALTSRYTTGVVSRDDFERTARDRCD